MFCPSTSHITHPKSVAATISSGPVILLPKWHFFEAKINPSPATKQNSNGHAWHNPKYSKPCLPILNLFQVWAKKKIMYFYDLTKNFQEKHILSWIWNTGQTFQTKNNLHTPSSKSALNDSILIYREKWYKLKTSRTNRIYGKDILHLPS